MAGLSREGITIRWMVVVGLEVIEAMSLLCTEENGDSLVGMSGMNSIEEREGCTRRFVRSNAWQNADGFPTWLCSMLA